MQKAFFMQKNSSWKYNYDTVFRGKMRLKKPEKLNFSGFLRDFSLGNIKFWPSKYDVNISEIIEKRVNKCN